MYEHEKNKKEAEKRTEEELIVLIALIDSLEEALILDILRLLLPIARGEVQNINKYKSEKLNEFTAYNKRIIDKSIKKISIQSNKVFWQHNINNMKYLNNMFKFEPMGKEEAKEIDVIINKNLAIVNTDVKNLFGILKNSAYKELLRDMDGIKYVDDKNKYILSILKRLTEQGLKIPQSENRFERMQTSVKRLYKTVLNKCFGDVTLCRAKYNGINHVLVSSHAGARHVDNPNPEYLSHDIWQGKVYKLKGERNLIEEYQTLPRSIDFCTQQF